VRRHYLQDEAETEEDATTPPAGLGEEVTRLPNSDERVGGGARPAKVRGQPSALSSLEQDRKHQDEAIDDQENQKKRVNH